MRSHFLPDLPDGTCTVDTDELERMITRGLGREPLPPGLRAHLPGEHLQQLWGAGSSPSTTYARVKTPCLQGAECQSSTSQKAEKWALIHCSPVPRCEGGGSPSPEELWEEA